MKGRPRTLKNKVPDVKKELESGDLVHKLVRGGRVELYRQLQGDRRGGGGVRLPLVRGVLL